MLKSKIKLIQFVTIISISLYIVAILPAPLITRAQEATLPSSYPIPTDSESQINADNETSVATKDQKTTGDTFKLNKARTFVESKLQIPHKNDVFFVKFKSNTSDEITKSISSSISPDDNDKFQNPILKANNIKVIKAGSEKKLRELMTQFKADDNVESVEVNSIFKKTAWTRNDIDHTAVPDDYNATTHWYYNKINLPELFYTQGCGTVSDENCGGSSTVTVAVIDTGVAFEDFSTTYTAHYGGVVTRTFSVAPELNGINLWTNPAEGSGGADLDGNGFCDDLHGVNILQWESDISWISDNYNHCGDYTELRSEGHPNDDEGHGTYVTSIVSSLVDNGVGTSISITPNIQIMPVKILDEFGSTGLFEVYLGIYYAVSEGADVINLSIEGPDPEGVLRDVIQYAKDSNVTIVAATGNHNTVVNYPAAYSSEFDNVISVGASQQDDTRSPYSNYGSNLDLVAPVGMGELYQQTYLDADTWSDDVIPIDLRNFTTFDYKAWAGTSFAAPQVAAAAASILSKHSQYKPSDIKSILTNYAIDIGTPGKDNETGYGLLDLKASYDYDMIAPTSDFIAQSTLGESPIAIQFTDQSIHDPLIPSVFLWDFGDSSSSSEQSPVHSYNTPGVYTVSLTVSNSAGSDIQTRSDYLVINGWTNWVGNGGALNEVSSANVGDKLFQSIRGFDSYVWTRYYDNSTGIWSDWTRNGGTLNAVSMASVGNKLFQSIRGFDGNTWTRYYDNSIEIWSDWSKGIVTSDVVSMATVVGKLFQAVRGIDGYIWTRYYDNLTETWSTWNRNGGGLNAVSMASVGDKLFQSIRGFDGYVWTRYYNDPTGNWTEWSKNGGALDTVSMASVGDKLFQSVRGFDSYIWTRYYDNSTGNWSEWSRNGGGLNAVNMASVGDKLFQSIRGFDGYIWTRYYNDSTGIWGEWSRNGGGLNTVSMARVGDKLFQSIRGFDSFVWTRYYDNTAPK